MTQATDHPPGVETIITPRTSDIGAMEVQRLLPSARRRMVGPFIFVDRMGPAVLMPDGPMAVRPHPHIGLSTVTYLFDGEIVHRDSLGFNQTITPGAVNLMTAGSGIVHSERSDPDRLAGGMPVYGMQIWMALPHALEETGASFNHYPADCLPVVSDKGVRIAMVLGSGFGEASPVRSDHPALYADIALDAGATLTIPAEAEERALYLLTGAMTLDGRPVRTGDMLVLAAGTTPVMRAEAGSRLLLLGGAAMDGPRHIWWNFVSSSKDRIEQAKEDWRQGRFPSVPGDAEFIPLPEQ